MTIATEKSLARAVSWLRLRSINARRGDVHGLFRMEFQAPGHADVTRVAVHSLEELDAVVDQVGRQACDRGMSFQVDLQASPLRRGDPILVQFLIGDNERSSLLWHEDGVGFAAVDPHLRPGLDDLPFVRFRDVECAPPAETQCAPRAVLDAVVVYLLTGERTESLGWREIEAD